MKKVLGFDIRLFTGLFMGLFMLCGVVNAEEGKKTGGYLEAGGLMMAPFAGEKIGIGDPTAGYTNFEVNPGGAFQLGVGYDASVVALGGKFYYGALPEDPAGSPTGGLSLAHRTSLEAEVFGMDFTTRLYLLELAQIPTEVVRPYLIAGIGWGIFNSDFRDTEAFWSLNFGGGIQFQVQEHLYLGVEGSYRPLFDADQCGGSDSGPFTRSVLNCDRSNDVHLVQAGVNVGVRF